MANNKYTRRQKYISTDGGLTFNPVTPPEYIKGELIETDSVDCGAEAITWVPVEDVYICEYVGVGEFIPEPDCNKIMNRRDFIDLTQISETTYTLSSNKTYYLYIGFGRYVKYYSTGATTWKKAYRVLEPDENGLVSVSIVTCGNYLTNAKTFSGNITFENVYLYDTNSMLAMPYDREKINITGKINIINETDEPLKLASNMALYSDYVSLSGNNIYSIVDEVAGSEKTEYDSTLDGFVKGGVVIRQPIPYFNNASVIKKAKSSDKLYKLLIYNYDETGWNNYRITLDGDTTLSTHSNAIIDFDDYETVNELVISRGASTNYVSYPNQYPNANNRQIAIKKNSPYYLCTYDCVNDKCYYSKVSNKLGYDFVDDLPTYNYLSDSKFRTMHDDTIRDHNGIIRDTINNEWPLTFNTWHYKRSVTAGYPGALFNEESYILYQPFILCKYSDDNHELLESVYPPEGYNIAAVHWDWEYMYVLCVSAVENGEFMVAKMTTDFTVLNISYYESNNKFRCYNDNNGYYIANYYNGTTYQIINFPHKKNFIYTPFWLIDTEQNKKYKLYDISHGWCWPHYRMNFRYTATDVFGIAT